MKIAVRLFARARDLAGSDQVFVEVADDARVADLRTALQQQVPSLAALVPHLHVALGTEYASDDADLSGVDKVTCFPPVSGG